MTNIDEDSIEYDENDDEMIAIHVQENTLNNQIMVFIPPDCWDLENLAEAIKRAVILVLANTPDKLDG